MSAGNPRPIRLPQGVRDYLPEAAARRQAIAEALLGAFERWGYRRIVTPAFEYESVLSRGLGAEAQAQAVRFVEPGTGEVVMLRPDITPQVARLVATRLHSEPGPIRLAYQGAVVRLAHGGQREVFQAGIELIDAPAPAGDVEVIALAAASLSAAGVRAFTIDLGEASVARAALSELPATEQDALRGAIARKDAEEAARLSHRLAAPAWRKRLLAEMPSLYGGAEVIERAQALVAGHDAQAEAGLAGLRTVVDRLAREGSATVGGAPISVDLGEVRGFDYYTGVRFQGFAPGVGDALLSGGRYDRLLARYGRAAGAAGFAVDVERVALALPENALPGEGIYLAGSLPTRARLASRLRQAGTRVCEDLDEGAALGDALRTKARAAGAERIAVLLAGDHGLRVETLAGRTLAEVDGRGLAAMLDGTGLLDGIVAARYLPGPLPGEPRGKP